MSNFPTPSFSYLSPGQKLGKYEIKRLLGRGGMAEVYQALNPDLNQDVAIKVLHPHIVDSESVILRFMELVEGPTLRNVLANYPDGMIPELAIHLFTQLCEAIAYAHENGIIHRDIKPANVLIANGTRPILTDFGLARVAGTARITSAGVTSGTPTYMAPEIAMGQDGQPESDIYSLGVMLFEMVTGQVPFKDDSVQKVLHQHIDAPPPRPSSLVGGLDQNLENTILRALEKDPQDRFPSARAMLIALTAGQKGGPGDTIQLSPSAQQQADSVAADRNTQAGNVRATSIFTQTISTMQRNPILSAGFLVALVLVAIGGLVIFELQRLLPATPPTVVGPAATAAPIPPDGMVLVPGGTFTMGTTKGTVDQRPAHDVTLGAYFIDKTEVTNSKYLAFVLDQAYPPPKNWTKRPSGQWVLDATDGFATGQAEARFSYDGKVETPVEGGVHFRSAVFPGRGR